jgi:hypothetical protein
VTALLGGMGYLLINRLQQGYAKDKNEKARGNLLVTGGLGYIGSITVAEILKKPSMFGYEKIIIIDTRVNAHKETLSRI